MSRQEELIASGLSKLNEQLDEGLLPLGVKMKLGLVKAGDLSAIPVKQIPIEKGEPLALELAHFVDSVAQAKQPKVGAALGKSALEVAITITDQIRNGTK